jgi:hypothetical protein
MWCARSRVMMEVALSGSGVVTRASVDCFRGSLLGSSKFTYNFFLVVFGARMRSILFDSLLVLSFVLRGVDCIPFGFFVFAVAGIE